MFYLPQIISDTLSFMVGGFHTSGYFMTWLFWYLAEHPAVQEKLVEEVEAEVGGECGEKLKQYALNPNTLVHCGVFAAVVTGIQFCDCPKLPVIISLRFCDPVTLQFKDASAVALIIETYW